MKYAIIARNSLRLLLACLIFGGLSARAALSVAVLPATLVQQTNTHLAFTAIASGGSGITYVWSGPNGTLANGTQSDGSFIAGATTPILLVSNLQTADTGSYTVTVNDTGGDPAANANASLTVKAKRLPYLATNNIVIARIGDGNEALSAVTGNTVYLDQYETNGQYISTVMIPDAGAASLLACGAGSNAIYEAALNISTNRYYLDFGGYNTNYPFTGSGVVNSNAHTSRMWSSVNGIGYYQENAGPGQSENPSGDFTGGGYYMRCSYSTDGVSNWWSVGTTGNNEVRTIPGAGSISESGVSKDNDLFVQYVSSAGAIVYSDTPGGTTNGLMAIPGTPTSGTAGQVLSVGASGNPNDFAVSPDNMTIYIADSRPYNGNTGGGVQRWDATGTQSVGSLTLPSWSLSYTLPVTATGTNGAIAVVVDFSSGSNWGLGSNGAVVYATACSAFSNSVVRIVDNGSASLPSLTIASATTGQLLRGVRFAPAQLPVTSVVGFNVALNGGSAAPATAVTYISPTPTTDKVIITGYGILGDQPLSYTWMLNGVTLANGTVNGTTIAGATTTNLTITGPQAANAGTYSLVPSNDVGAVAFQATVLDVEAVSISPTNALVVPGAGTNFVVTETGAAAVSYQWYENGSPLTGSTAAGGSTVAGANTATLQLSNINQGDNNATFYCLVTTAYGSLASSNATLLVANPSFTNNPVSQTVNATGTAILTASALGVPAPAYTWQLAETTLANGPQANGTTIFGATTSSLTISNVLCALNGQPLMAVASNSQNVATSAQAYLTVVDPYITSSPGNVYLKTVSTVQLSVAAVGTAALTYQWFFDNGPLSDGPNPNSDGSSFSGSLTPTLTITGAAANEAGSYYALVTSPNCSTSTNSLTAVVYYETSPVQNVSVWPPLQVVKAGSHVGFEAMATDQNSGPIFYQWYYTNSAGSWTTLNGQTNAGLVISGIAAANAGTYLVTLGNAYGTNFASSGGVLVVSNNYIPLSPANLIVARVGDNVQTLSGTTGNTVYLDQYTTNGTYLNSFQVPDSGSKPVVELGAGIDAPYETYLTLSSNQNFLNFAGYGYAYPYTGGGTVNDNNADTRSVCAMNALGYFSVPDTANGDYTTGGEYFRSVFSTDGLTNFFLLGVTANNGGRTVVIGGTPGAFSVNSVNIDDDRCIGMLGSNVVFTDSSIATTGGANASGIEFINGSPTSGTIVATNGISVPAANSVNDFAFSPDGNTVYVADDDIFEGSGQQLGGIERYDTNPAGGGWTWSYTLQVGSGANINAGATALAAVFPANIGTWGANVTGAILYAVTTGTSSNSLISIVDTGASATPTTLATTGGNELLRGLRFGPTAVPFTASISPSTLSSPTGGTLTIAANVSGYAPLTYQWSLNGTNLANGTDAGIDPDATFAGATTATLTVDNLSAAEDGVFTLTVNNVASASVAASVTNTVAVPTPPQFGAITTLSPTSIQLSYSGTSGASYRLWGTTNIALTPVTSTWSLLTNGVFGGSPAVYTDSTSIRAARFYVITVP